MDESNRTVSRRSWGNRLRGSFRGIVFGVACLVAAAWFLFWNEGRAVKRYRALQEGGGIVASIDPTTVEPVNEGKLIHFSALAHTGETLSDDAFNLSVQALHLERQVEMYQWRELSKSRQEKKLGGGTETVTDYSYERAWVSDVIDSTRFKMPEGHQNPGYFAYPNLKVSARNVQGGAFRLPPGLVSRITSWQPVAVRLEQLPSQLRWKSHPYEGGIFIGRDPSAPAVGDLRVRFRSVPATWVSVVASQIGDSLQPYVAANGEQIQLLRAGTVDAEAMFEGAQRGNRTTTWLFRFLGFFAVFFGFTRVFKPLSVVGDIVPVIGNALETGTKMLSFLLAGGVSAVIIAVAWLYYRPFLALLIFSLAALSIVGIVRLVRQTSAKPAVQPPPPPSR